ncbi:hypothetical protein ABPG75_012335 [Micractinium tetrahymenae]
MPCVLRCEVTTYAVAHGASLINSRFKSPGLKYPACTSYLCPSAPPTIALRHLQMEHSLLLAAAHGSPAFKAWEGSLAAVTAAGYLRAVDSSQQGGANWRSRLAVMPGRAGRGALQAAPAAAGAASAPGMA